MATADGGQPRSTARSAVDKARNRFPYAVVWGPLGPCTLCCPCVGHMGIGDSEGKIHDFAGPFDIGVDNFMVGCVWRYVGSHPHRRVPRHPPPLLAHRRPPCLTASRHPPPLARHPPPATRHLVALASLPTSS